MKKLTIVFLLLCVCFFPRVWGDEMKNIPEIPVVKTIDAVVDTEYNMVCVPVVPVFTALGYEAQWEKEIGALTFTDKSKNTIVLFLNSRTVLLNNFSRQVTFPAKQINGVLTIPISSLTEINNMFFLRRDTLTDIKWAQNSNKIALKMSDYALEIKAPRKLCYITSEQEVKIKLDQLRNKYPHGTYWAHEGTQEDWERQVTYHGKAVLLKDNIYSAMVTREPAKKGENNIGENYYKNNHNIIGYQCYGFALKLSDEIFGTDAPYQVYENDFGQIRIGDHVRIQGKEHSVLVIDKTETGITVAEANLNEPNRINWDRTIDKTTLDQYGFYITTRY